MRTKTLILSGLLAAITGASALAQVYSLNAVGYINVDVPPGWSIIADQLYATNQQTSQSIDAILGPQLLNGGATTPDPYAQNGGVIVFPWVNGGFEAALGVVQIVAGTAPSWTAPTEAVNTSFNPGQAVFIYNPNADFQMTFVGQVPQGSVTNQMYYGWNLVSSIIPQTGAIDTDLGLVPNVTDTVFVWGNGAYLAADEWISVNGNPPAWSTGVSPTNTVGTGFFYLNLNSASNPTNYWSRTFNIN